MNHLHRRIANLESHPGNNGVRVQVITGLSAAEIAAEEALTERERRQLVWVDTGVTRAPGAA